MGSAPSPLQVAGSYPMGKNLLEGPGHFEGHEHLALEKPPKGQVPDTSLDTATTLPHVHGHAGEL